MNTRGERLRGSCAVAKQRQEGAQQDIRLGHVLLNPVTATAGTMPSACAEVTLPHLVPNVKSVFFGVVAVCL